MRVAEAVVELVTTIFEIAKSGPAFIVSGVEKLIPVKRTVWFRPRCTADGLRVLITGKAGVTSKSIALLKTLDKFIVTLRRPTVAKGEIVKVEFIPPEVRMVLLTVIPGPASMFKKGPKLAPFSVTATDLPGTPLGGLMLVSVGAGIMLITFVALVPEIFAK